EALAHLDGLRTRAMGFEMAIATSQTKSELDPKTVLLETLLSNDRSYIWLADESGTQFYYGPKASELTRMATSAWSCFAEGRECRAEGQALSQALLGPGWKKLRGKRIVVAGDGILSYFPLGALPDPSSAEGTPILQEQEVMLVPSLHAMAGLRRESGKMGVPREVRVLADPVYEAQDERLRGKPTREGGKSVALEQALSSGGVARTLSRLRHSGGEVEALRETFCARAACEMAVGFAATREAFLKPVQQGSILHIATHGIVNENDPELSGLAFSQWSQDGEWVDGYWPLGEMGDRKVAARLVVLSACQTACGRQYFGQGAFSLANGFLRAGARTVVASNWNVNDAATAQLMKLFYRRLAADGKMRVGKALREAQLELRSRPEWRKPYFWAGFSAYGEWR
ncbi:MAG: CHAT domain-containing protein, partial [Acidobacteria bacterium]|nr:CHAT domain-containing protein [Acidobacteriota bacterium]